MIEPDLQSMIGEAMTYATSNPSECATVDIAVNSFWGGRYDKSFLNMCSIHMPCQMITQASAVATGSMRTKQS